MTRATTLCAISRSALALGRRSAAFLLVVTLGGCVTGATIPNSPFLTAMVRLNPVAAGSSATAMAASNANSPLDANAAATDLPLRGSLSQSASAPVAGGAPQQTPTPCAFIAPSPERSQVYPQLAAAQSNLIYFRCARDVVGGWTEAGERRAGTRGKIGIAGRSRGRRGSQPSLDGSPGCQGDGLTRGCENCAGRVEAAAAGLCGIRRIVSRFLPQLSATVRLGRHSRQFALGRRVHTQTARV